MYLHAQVVELLLALDGARVEAVVVRTPSGKTVRFEADEVVLAAGTVETARLMLASRSVATEGVGNANDQVGRNFHDHVTLPAATLTGVARARVVSELRPWVFFAGGIGDVRGGTLHSVKLEASRELRGAAGAESDTGAPGDCGAGGVGDRGGAGDADVGAAGRVWEGADDACDEDSGGDAGWGAADVGSEAAGAAVYFGGRGGEAAV